MITLWALAFVGTLLAGAAMYGVQRWWLNRRSGTTECRQCRGLKSIYVDERIPVSELDPMTYAEMLVLGGHAVRKVRKPCPRCVVEPA